MVVLILCYLCEEHMISFMNKSLWIICSDYCFSSIRCTLKLFYNMISLDLASGTKEDSNNIGLLLCHDIINVSF